MTSLIIVTNAVKWPQNSWHSIGNIMIMFPRYHSYPVWLPKQTHVTCIIYLATSHSQCQVLFVHAYRRPVQYNTGCMGVFYYKKPVPTIWYTVHPVRYTCSSRFIVFCYWQRRIYQYPPGLVDWRWDNHCPDASETTQGLYSLSGKTLTAKSREASKPQNWML